MNDTLYYLMVSFALPVGVIVWTFISIAIDRKKYGKPEPAKEPTEIEQHLYIQQEPYNRYDGAEY